MVSFIFEIETIHMIVVQRDVDLVSNGRVGKLSSRHVVYVRTLSQD